MRTIIAIILLLCIASAASASTGWVFRATCSTNEPYNLSSNGWWYGVVGTTTTTGRYGGGTTHSVTGMYMSGAGAGANCVWWFPSNSFNVAISGASAVAWSGWITSTNNAANKALQKCNSGANAIFVLRRSSVATNAELRGRARSSDGFSGITNASINFAPSADTLAHVYAVLDFGNGCAKLYTNGYIAASQAVVWGAATFQPPGNTDFQLFGDAGGATYAWHGRGQDVRIFTYSLTDAQILELATNGPNGGGVAPPPPPPPVFRAFVPWRF